MVIKKQDQPNIATPSSDTNTTAQDEVVQAAEDAINLEEQERLQEAARQAEALKQAEAEKLAKEQKVKPATPPLPTEEKIEDYFPRDIKNDALIAVRVRDGDTFWRGGIQFNDEFKVLRRSEVASEDNWLRIAHEPNLEIRAVTLITAKG